MTWRRAARALRPGLDPSTGTGPLEPPVAETLLAAAAALLAGMPWDPARYAALFDWHAEHIPGYRDVYERFAGALGEGFAQRPVGERHTIVVRAAAMPSGTRRAWASLATRRRWEFDRLVRQQVYAYFARTDAWLAAGHSRWPGAAA